MAKALRNDRKPLPPIDSTTGLVYTDEEKAEAFADSLELQCRTNEANADLDHVDEIEQFARNVRHQHIEEPIPPCSPAEIRELIKSLHTRKAPGPDSISNRAMKKRPDKALVALTAIVNAIFRLRCFPKCWKCADVIFILKPGKSPKFPQNYRPISLLSAAGKIAERLIHVRLGRTVEELQILPDEQFGFRPHHSTIDQLIRLVEYASTSLN
ncbi:RVT 1 domain containing protein [Asbolus verrucosus]|uniref:RVT 1 domain containing protein n=1 Tax=Asbolus verrucosus TaxID=1661398 RepID=A0A482W949_ASBVE|nr:RVT 1 domain containing protein [Asbolus verrucosus]